MNPCLFVYLFVMMCILLLISGQRGGRLCGMAERTGRAGGKGRGSGHGNKVQVSSDLCFLNGDLNNAGSKNAGSSLSLVGFCLTNQHNLHSTDFFLISV